MIRQSELLSIIAQTQRYAAAVDIFQKKYNALPGDMANAETIWGSDTTCPGTAYNTTPKTATCNGNGDGRVYDNVGNTYPYEVHRFWQHLSNASMIEGAYTGAQGNLSATHPIASVNAPATRIKNATLQMRHNYYVSGATDVFPVTVHSFDFCNFSSAGVCGGLLSPSEAELLDIKADDGLPSKGQIITWKPAYLASCADSSNENTARYNVSATTEVCGLKFLLGN